MQREITCRRRNLIIQNRNKKLIWIFKYASGEDKQKKMTKDFTENNKKIATDKCCLCNNFDGFGCIMIIVLRFGGFYECCTSRHSI